MNLKNLMEDKKLDFNQPLLSVGSFFEDFTMYKFCSMLLFDTYWLQSEFFVTMFFVCQIL
jgi:hypothetical protein